MIDLWPLFKRHNQTQTLLSISKHKLDTNAAGAVNKVIYLAYGLLSRPVG